MGGWTESHTPACSQEAPFGERPAVQAFLCVCFLLTLFTVSALTHALILGLQDAATRLCTHATLAR